VVQFLFNLLFGWLKKIIDDIIKALLLLEFEKLLKKKAKLAESLEEDKERLEELCNLIDELLESAALSSASSTRARRAWSNPSMRAS